LNSFFFFVKCALFFKTEIDKPSSNFTCSKIQPIYIERHQEQTHLQVVCVREHYTKPLPKSDRLECLKSWLFYPRKPTILNTIRWIPSTPYVLENLKKSCLSRFQENLCLQSDMSSWWRGQKKKRSVKKVIFGTIRFPTLFILVKSCAISQNQDR
jgi:hypothetical protein